MALRIFLSYSHRDSIYLQRDSLVDYLKKGLKGTAKLWHDGELITGDMWNDVIIKKIDDSQIIIALVSRYFLKSHYCTKIEIRRFLENARKKTGLTIFPIILSRCNWKAYKWMQVRQYIPAGDKTIEKDYSTPRLRKKLYKKILSDLRIQVKRAANPGNAAFQSLSSEINLLNDLTPGLRRVITGEPVKKKKHRLMFEGKDDELVATKDNKVHISIRFEDFRKRLSPAAFRHIMIFHRRIVGQYRMWARLDSKRYNPQTGLIRKNIDVQQKQLIREMKVNLLRIIEYLQQIGFELEDHYAEIYHLLKTFR
jgi:TIR domain